MPAADNTGPIYVLTSAVDPALRFLSTLGIPITDKARLEVLAIAGQESAWTYRQQIGGPAHSLWQFEKGGGVAGVFNHPSTKDKLAHVCAHYGIPHDIGSIYQAMALEANDEFSACMARLLLWTDARPLPEVGQRDAAWNYYVQIWRPGAPHPENWAQNYMRAKLAATGT